MLRGIHCLILQLVAASSTVPTGNIRWTDVNGTSHSCLATEHSRFGTGPWKAFDVTSMAVMQPGSTWTYDQSAEHLCDVGNWGVDLQGKILFVDIWIFIGGGAGGGCRMTSGESHTDLFFASVKQAGAIGVVMFDVYAAPAPGFLGFYMGSDNMPDVDISDMPVLMTEIISCGDLINALYGGDVSVQLLPSPRYPEWKQNYWGLVDSPGFRFFRIVVIGGTQFINLIFSLYLVYDMIKNRSFRATTPIVVLIMIVSTMAISISWCDGDEAQACYNYGVGTLLNQLIAAPLLANDLVLVTPMLFLLLPRLSPKLTCALWVVTYVVYVAIVSLFVYGTAVSVSGTLDSSFGELESSLSNGLFYTVQGLYAAIVLSVFVKLGLTVKRTGMKDSFKSAFKTLIITCTLSILLNIVRPIDNELAMKLEVFGFGDDQPNGDAWGFYTLRRFKHWTFALGASVQLFFLFRTRPSSSSS